MNSPLVGSILMLKGIRSNPSYNGQSVEVMKFDPIQNRFVVQPVQPNTPLPSILRVKPHNLSPCLDGEASESALPKTEFALCGLPNSAFNGHKVSIVQYVREKQRYQVTPLNPKSPLPQLLLVKPDNLRPGDVVSFLAESDIDSGVSSSSSSRRSMFQHNFKAASESSIQCSSRRGSNFPKCMDRAGSLSDVNNHSCESVSSRSIVGTLIPKGSHARLRGLQVQPSLNGSIVEVHDYIGAMHRYRAALKGGGDESSDVPRVMVVQPQNLELVPEDECSTLASQSSRSQYFQAGEKVKLAGLVAQPQLNGSIVTVDDYLPEKGRYRIQMEDDLLQTMTLHPRHLEKYTSRHSSAASVESLFNSSFSSLPSPCKSPRKSSISSVGQQINNYPTLSQLVDCPISDYEVDEPMEIGSRVVLSYVDGKSSGLSGELAVILQYLSGQCAYRVRLLGAKAIAKSGSVEELQVSTRNVKSCSATAFWATMTIQGQSIRVPATCELVSDRKKQLRVRLDAFAGIDRVIPGGKLLLGDDKCDWMSERDVISTLYKSPTPPLKCVVPPGPDDVTLLEDEILVNVPSSSKNSLFRAMVEYELLRPTVRRSGNCGIYKACFPIETSNDDENPFAERPETKTLNEAISSSLDATVVIPPIPKQLSEQRREKSIAIPASPTSKMIVSSRNHNKSRNAIDPPANIASSTITTTTPPRTTDNPHPRRVIPKGNNNDGVAAMNLGIIAALAAKAQAARVITTKQQPPSAPTSIKDTPPQCKPPARVTWSDTVEELTFLVSS